MYNPSNRSGLIQRNGLIKTRCSYLPSDTPNKRGQSIFGRIPIITATFGFSLFLLFFWGSMGENGAPPMLEHIWLYIVACDLVIFGILLIVEGWTEFRLSQTIEDIPTSKIDGAAEGLNEINAQFIPEKADALTSPMAAKKCVYYQITLEKYIHAGKQSRWEACIEIEKGVPTLLTDGTGYLALPLYDADLNERVNFYYPKNAKGQIVENTMPEGMSLMSLFQSDPTSKSIAGLELTFGEKEAIDPSLDPFTRANELRVSEIVLPVGTNYFVMGRVANTAGILDGKPIKIMDYDRGTKLLSVRTESKAGIETFDKRLSYFALALGAAALISSLGFLLAA